jgi:ElaB/YqjD/DUF883 family membrane-anchored ribosome-binding protein
LDVPLWFELLKNAFSSTFLIADTGTFFMPTSKELKDEVSQLKSDADTTRRPRRTRTTKRQSSETSPPPNLDNDTVDSTSTEELRTLTDQLTNLVQDAEHEIKEHPVAMVLGAFALGVVVGAVLRR